MRDFLGHRTSLVATAAVFVLVAVLLWHIRPQRAEPGTAVAPSTPASFVGAKACTSCHAEEVAAWKTSQHAAAMQEATAETVLGHFADASIQVHGVTSRFFRRDGKFFVNTDGPDGALADFEVLYTFGVAPLQQYLVALPGGRLQALPLAWDARPAAQGGQRWFHLYPGERITHRDALHWTRLSQNWNSGCAACHSTNLRRNYDASADAFATTWSEISVSCEACHGPASRHVEWARAPEAGASSADRGFDAPLDERRGIAWLAAAGEPTARRSAPRTTQRELDACGQCHARRALGPDLRHGEPLLERQMPSLLEAGLYHPDGQQLDEVYNHASFLQSRMHAAGVTCSDCHEPHGGKLRAEGNAVCAQCHAPGRFDAPAHTLHAAGSPGARCAACHMPTRTYMQIDARHDHSIRIPRPDLSDALGTPNACNDCHADRSARWAAQAIERAHGPQRKGFQAFGPALLAGRTGAPGAVASLEALLQDSAAPAIARATALGELRGAPAPRLLRAIAQAARDSDPLVRGAALDALLRTPLPERLAIAEPLLDDAVGMVRIKAARALAATELDALPADRRARIEQGFARYVDWEQAGAERPEAHWNLGLFFEDRRDAAQAEREYRTALRLADDFTPAYVNLADLLRTLGREPDAVALLDAGLQRNPRNAELSYALALARARAGDRVAATGLLAQAAAARPDVARYAYVYAVALHDGGDVAQARAVLARALERFPHDRDLLATAVAYATESGDRKAALEFARRLAAFAGDDPATAGPLQALQ